MSDRDRGIATMIERLEMDVLGAVASDPQHRPGIVGDATTLVVTSRAITPHLAARVDNAPAFADAQRLEVRYIEAQRTLQMRRDALLASPEGRANFSTLATDLGRVQFRYHDGARWRETFDAAADGGLPAAIEVSMWFDDPEPSVLGSGSGDVVGGEEEDDEPGNFDEFAVAMEEGTESRSALPPPDRLRILTIPDAVRDEPDDGEALP